MHVDHYLFPKFTFQWTIIDGALKRIFVVQEYRLTGSLVNQMSVDLTNQDMVEMKQVELPEMSGIVRPFYQSKSGDTFPFWVELTRVDWYKLHAITINCMLNYALD